jgi:hypothetical protein
MKQTVLSILLLITLLCGCQPKTAENTITAEMALEGVSNYCHSEYDWSAAEGDPELMYVAMGEETDSAYQVVFRSYTGAQVFFYVDKASGSTRMIEHVPALGIESEAGTMDLFDYLDRQD